MGIQQSHGSELPRKQIPLIVAVTAASTVAPADVPLAADNQCHSETTETTQRSELRPSFGALKELNETIMKP